MSAILKEPLDPTFQRILANFIKQYGEEKGTSLFYAWVNKHNLDYTKAYDNQAQLGECFGELCESFNWLDQPLINYYKSDDTGKYYRCVALTANISMNMNDYSDVEEFKQAAGTLTWRPLNLNHNHSKFLPFPANRVDYARFEDNRVETIIRIDNKQRDIQRMIENGEILHPSIEATPRGLKITDRKTPSKWNYTALALLQKDVTLPGDPLTYLEPLPLNEGLGRSLVESLSVEKEKTDMSDVKTSSTNTVQLSEGEGIDNMDVCGQCRFYRELSDTSTTQPKATGQPDDATITKTSGAIGPGVGICEVATRLQGVNVFVRKSDPVCTDGRVRDTATDVDRTKEGINMSEIEKEAIKADYEKRLAESEKQLYEETQRTNQERESKLTNLVKLTEQANTLKVKEREIANLTGEVTRTKEERGKLREEVDKLREETSSLNIQITERDKDIKHYRDRYDAYERTHKELRDETLMLKEQLTSSITKRDEEALQRADASQRALNAEHERARIAEENAILVEKLAQLQQEIYDSSRIRANTAKSQIESNKLIEEMRKERDGMVNTIRDLKQKIAQQPRRIVVKG